MTDYTRLAELEAAAAAAVRALTPGNFLLLAERVRQLEQENAQLAAMLADWARGGPPELLADYGDDPEEPDAATFRAAARRAVERL